MSRWMLNQRPRGDDDAAKRGYAGRRLRGAELAAEAARLGLPVANMDTSLTSVNTASLVHNRRINAALNLVHNP
jgi:hypothetical protein